MTITEELKVALQEANEVLEEKCSGAFIRFKELTADLEEANLIINIEEKYFLATMKMDDFYEAGASKLVQLAEEIASESNMSVFNKDGEFFMAEAEELWK